MPNQVNPFSAPLAALKQIGEQTNTAIQSVGSGLATAASQGLDVFIQAAPPLPGVPGVPAAVPGIPPQGLMPANLQQALGQIENVLIPPGMPRLSQAIAGLPPTPTPAPTPPPTPAPTPEVTGAVAARRRIAERRGL